MKPIVPRGLCVYCGGARAPTRRRRPAWPAAATRRTSPGSRLGGAAHDPEVLAAAGGADPAGRVARLRGGAPRARGAPSRCATGSSARRRSSRRGSSGTGRCDARGARGPSTPTTSAAWATPCGATARSPGRRGLRARGDARHLPAEAATLTEEAWRPSGRGARGGAERRSSSATTRRTRRATGARPSPRRRWRWRGWWPGACSARTGARGGSSRPGATRSRRRRGSSCWRRGTRRSPAGPLKRTCWRRSRRSRGSLPRRRTPPGARPLPTRRPVPRRW